MVKEDAHVSVPVLNPTLTSIILGPVRCMSVSLSLWPEVSKLRDDLAKVAVVSILDGAMNEKSVLEVLPSIINIPLVGPITPMNDCSFLVPLSSRDQVKEVCKLDVMKVVTKDGLCSLKVAP